jgi:hypothetical protein
VGCKCVFNNPRFPDDKSTVPPMLRSGFYSTFVVLFVFADSLLIWRSTVAARRVSEETMSAELPKTTVCPNRLYYKWEAAGAVFN